MLPWLSGIGSDVLTPGNFQAYIEMFSSRYFYTQAPGSCVHGCNNQESRKIISLSIIVALPQLRFTPLKYDTGLCMRTKNYWNWHAPNTVECHLSGLQKLSRIFSYLDTLWSHCVWITDILLYMVVACSENVEC